MTETVSDYCRVMCVSNISLKFALLSVLLLYVSLSVPLGKGKCDVNVCSCTHKDARHHMYILVLYGCTLQLDLCMHFAAGQEDMFVLHVASEKESSCVQ